MNRGYLEVAKLNRTDECRARADRNSEFPKSFRWSSGTLLTLLFSLVSLLTKVHHFPFGVQFGTPARSRAQDYNTVPMSQSTSPRSPTGQLSGSGKIHGSPVRAACDRVGLTSQR